MNSKVSGAGIKIAVLDTGIDPTHPDFGMCKENISEENLTKTFCGTPNFIAPEIIREESYGFSADWWTLGVLTYEMLLGRTPFHARDSGELYMKIKNEEPRYPPALSSCAKVPCSAHIY